MTEIKNVCDYCGYEQITHNEDLANWINPKVKLIVDSYNTYVFSLCHDCRNKIAAKRSGFKKLIDKFVFKKSPTASSEEGK